MMSEKIDDFYDTLKREIEKCDAKILSAEELRLDGQSFSEIELDSVRRNLLVDFGEYGFHLPDFDRIVYDSKSYEAIAVIFSSGNLAWGIAESAYWKMKYDAVSLTKHIKVCFVALSENDALDDNRVKLDTVIQFQRELDGCYTLCGQRENHVKITALNELIADAKNWIENNQR